ncbi:alpha/beta hydrolase, partial [Acidobacteriia bacterium AH_259_A11_L15]|nr:alpha/beta hydrolase [Acidobacteriia bacterium AH_259_A11_L15]
AGMLYQILATQADRRNFPPPGKLVDVGGHRLHIHCVGEGRPTVVLETGALGMSALWGWVQPQVAVHTRVCSYDRAGLGWSEPGPEPRNAVRITGELRTLLINAGETPPYVFVGHSFGGLLVRVYADRYPEDVAGLVLVDSSHPDQGARLEKVRGKQSKPPSLEARLFGLFPVLARVGVLRFGMRFTDRLDDLPPRQAAEFKAFLVVSSHQSAGKAEIAVWEETAAQARATRPLGDLPLVVISAEGDFRGTKTASLRRRVRLELHRELAALSSRGSHRILAGTTHGSLVTNRSHASQVAEAIRELVEATRTQGEKK